MEVRFRPAPPIFPCSCLPRLQLSPNRHFMLVRPSMGQICPNLASEADKKRTRFCSVSLASFRARSPAFSAALKISSRMKHRATQYHSGFCPCRTDSVVRPFYSCYMLARISGRRQNPLRIARHSPGRGLWQSESGWLLCNGEVRIWMPGFNEAIQKGETAAGVCYEEQTIRHGALRRGV